LRAQFILVAENWCIFILWDTHQDFLWADEFDMVDMTQVIAGFFINNDQALRAEPGF
jgi:hypothetical protein